MRRNQSGCGHVFAFSLPTVLLFSADRPRPTSMRAVPILRISVSELLWKSAVALLPFPSVTRRFRMPSIQSLIDEYARSLASLSGKEFQAEVCARLQTFIIGFQNVPEKPFGDAGLDAFSDHGERGYCCYGPEHNAFKSNKKLENDIVEKFKEDLRRLYELKFNDKVLQFYESPEMATILPTGHRLRQIELLVNWFESHRVLNPILTAAEEYAKASKCRYATKDATVIVVGPKDLANRYAVDEVTITRARQRIFLHNVQIKAQTVTLGSTGTFDVKMQSLKEMNPPQAEQVEALGRDLQVKWRVALAFEQELGDTLPGLRRDWDANRGRILTKVLTLMATSQKPWAELNNAMEMARDILQRDFEKLYGALIEDLSSGEVARLIGECPVGWKEPIQLA